MASFFPAVKNAAAGYTFYVSLISQANTKIAQANPTLAAGDVKIAVDDAAPANLTTLPVVDADFTKRVKVVLSQAETNGDNLTIIFSDAAGAEWCDLTINIQTVARRFDDLAYPATSGRSMVVDAAGLVDANCVKLGPTGAGTAQTAKDVGGAVPAAAAGAAGGLWILGANAAATTTLTGVAAAGATPATPALQLTGGAASITAGGVAAQALLATGGAGAASTNGAAEGVKFVGGGTNTVASNAHGLTVTGTSTGSGLGATSGAGATGNGITATAASTNGSGMTLIKTGTGSDLNAIVTPLTLAKTTNITGFNDIAATAIVSAGAITTSGGAVSTVTNTTQLNGAATVVLTDASSDAVIADAVWNAATVTYGGAGSYGLLIETDLDATISSRLAPAGTLATVTNLTNAPTAGDLTAAMKTSVNAEVVDALNVDTYAEPAQGTPSATLSIAQKLGYLFKAWRNRSTQTASDYKLYNDDAVTVDHKAATSDDATTFDRGEIATGP